MIQNKYLIKAKNGESAILIHNGYDPFSYGNVTNPIVLNFSEYELLKNFFSKINNRSFFEEFEQSNKYDLDLSDVFFNTFGYRLLTISANEYFRFSSDDEKQKSEKKKKELIKILLSLNCQINWDSLFLCT